MSDEKFGLDGESINSLTQHRLDQMINRSLAVPAPLLSTGFTDSIMSRIESGKQSSFVSDWVWAVVFSIVCIVTVGIVLKNYIEPVSLVDESVIWSLMGSLETLVGFVKEISLLLQAIVIATITLWIDRWRITLWR